MRDWHSAKIATFASITLTVGLIGCGQAQPSSHQASLATSLTLEELVAGPLQEADLVAVTALVESLDEANRPAFSPALDAIPTDGLSAVDLLSTYRRSYLAALDAETQASHWRENRAVVEAARQAGLSLNELAVLFTRIGCAHHAAESGTAFDIAQARASGEAKIAQLLPQIDAARDPLQRKTLAESLGNVVAFDAYLTLLDLVPVENRQLVTTHRDRLRSILPPTPDITVVPGVRAAGQGPSQRTR